MPIKKGASVCPFFLEAILLTAPNLPIYYAWLLLFAMANWLFVWPKG